MRASGQRLVLLCLATLALGGWLATCSELGAAISHFAAAAPS